MKKKFLILAVTGLMTGSLYTACNSPEKKVENASENVVEAQQDLDQAEREYAEEWGKFKSEYQLQIQTNENDIAGYRELEKMDPAYRTKYSVRIDELEAKNTELKDRINKYESEKRRDNWEEFKAEFKRDMDELGAALKDFGKDNKR